ncbi:titin homolog [Betta splendens]|uniref:Titin homolog n=1 Tax=Betta splendens TaxID=158456 RepID=A0A9W2XWW5_BETSP|nr:titin homolog [Betta splendens]XP_055366080.1 titin homolog [Betta splendens]
MLTPVETDKLLEAQQVRSSSRERRLTEKGQEMHEQEARKTEKAFNKAYDSWKQTAKEIRVRLKSYCSLEDLGKSQRDIKAGHAIVQKHYETILRNHTSAPDIVKRMDACVTLTAETCELVSKRLESIDEAFNDQLEKERVRMVLNKEEYGSVFGNTNTETVISESARGSDSDSNITSRSSTKRADAEADLAAKLEQAKAVQRIQAQQAKLNKMESEWKLKESQMLSEIRQREAEMKSKLEDEQLRLQQMQAENEVKVAAARVRVYNIFDSVENNEEESDYKILPSCQNVKIETPLNPQAAEFQRQHATLEAQSTQDAVSLAQAIASSLTLNRLPVPEPTVFTGDPLKFLDWKLSFTTLIDQKPLPVSEKMLYLKSYLAGEAQKAVKGFFYRNTEDAYNGAWTVLQDRYGSPFIIQRAFRDKLTKWPKIAANDPPCTQGFCRLPPRLC